MKVQFLTILTALACLGFSASLAAHPCKHHSDNNHEHCARTGDAGGKSEKGFSATVIFDQNVITGGTDNIKSDGGTYPATMPVEGSPPGQFLMVLRQREDRFLFFDFGAAVNCGTGAASTDPKTDLCVLDDSLSLKAAACPFPPGSRALEDTTPDDSVCSGFRRGYVTFRHAFVNDVDTFILGMPNDGTQYGGEADNIEIDLGRDKKGEDDFRLRFDENCLGHGDGEFLKVRSWDNVDGDGVHNDEWKIDTFGPLSDVDKRACLTSKAKGEPEVLEGVFDMTFGYTICILTQNGNTNCPNTSH